MFYSWNGYGIVPLDVISIIQLVLSQIFIAFLLCMISFGWTITSESLESDDLDIAIPIGIFVLIIHALIGGLIYLDNEEHHKYHDY